MISVHKVNLPYKALSNVELSAAIDNLHIPKCRGVFLRNTLPKKPWAKECGIVNLDDTMGSGTHWVAWYKDGHLKYYYDSYGVQPPQELMNYLGQNIYYSTEETQPRGTLICGHLCLYILKELSQLKSVDKNHIQHVINKLY